MTSAAQISFRDALSRWCDLSGCLGRVAVLILTLCFGRTTIAQPNDRGVRDSIVRGVTYLKGVQSQDGTWDTWGVHPLGETALAGMALIAGGQPVDSPAVTAAADAVRRHVTGDDRTYDIALTVMFLDRLGLPRDAELLRRLGRNISSGQCAQGSWSYGLRPAISGDNSNTQFAALAAWVSRRHGASNDAALQRLDEHFRTTFNSAGNGWGYSSGSPATPTMTCAGLVGLAVPRGARYQSRESERGPISLDAQPGQGGNRGPAAADDPIAKQALAALGAELRKADKNPLADINSDLYFFWSLERVAVIYDLKEIGGVDWYGWGSQRLVKGQSANGEWRGKSGSKNWPFEQAVGTSFGILFLSRANVAADLSEAVGSGDNVGAPPPGPGGGTQALRRATNGDEQPPPPAIPKQPPAKKPAKKPTPGPGVLDPF
jgi:hypothetical protein